MDQLIQSFNHRIRSASHAKRRLPFREIPMAARTNYLDEIFRHSCQTQNRVIYIHIPFCNNTCNFCFYNKQKTDNPELVEHYCQTIISQIHSLASFEYFESAPFSAVYFGGGTPTSIPVKHLVSILNAIKSSFSLTDTCEITVESTIAEIDTDTLSILKNAGVNRMSLGVQTFQTPLRHSLGRKSDAGVIDEKIRLVRKAGISNLCIDLMYNLPGQTPVGWQNDLILASQLPITGCSVYPLIDPSSGSDNVQFPNLKNPEISAEYTLFAEADNRLGNRKGWIRFSPVQYGHSELGKATYISLHAQYADMLAFGAGAGGRFGGLQYLFPPVIDKFVEGNGNFINSALSLWSIDSTFQKLKNIFRLSEGLAISKEEYSGLAIHFNDIIDWLISKDMVALEADTYELTQAGRFWAGNISSLFSERINNRLQSE